MYLNFSPELKSPDKNGQSLVLIVAYSRIFESNRFVLSAGVKVKAKTFNKARPGKVIDNLLKICRDAVTSLNDEGKEISKASLSARIQAMRRGYAWIDPEEKTEIQVWTGKPEYFAIPDGVDRNALESDLINESAKHKPDYCKVIATNLAQGKTGLFGFWDDVLTGKIRPKGGKDLRASTVSTKRQTYEIVREFSPGATFEDMSMKFYNEFTAWMGKQRVYTTGPDGKRISKPRFDRNTQGKHVKELKSILNLAYRNELMQNDRFRFWSVVQESNNVVTLNREEVLKINALELSGVRENVRDIFILACFLGPRISDYKSFRKESISVVAGVTWFEYVQEKTDQLVRIPVHPIAKAILDKRDGDFPEMISEQNFRYNLKSICEDAELFDRVIVKIRDGKPEYKKKFEAISPHTARRTFATSLFYGWFSKPMPASLCMRYTGHRTEKSFMLYIGATDKDLEEKALEYFDVQLMKAV